MRELLDQPLQEILKVRLRRGEAPLQKRMRRCGKVGEAAVESFDEQLRLRDDSRVTLLNKGDMF